MTKESASKLFCWIGKLEIALENIHTAVTDFFAEESRESRRRMLECLISQRQLWEDRPMDEIQQLINKEKEDD